MKVLVIDDTAAELSLAGKVVEHFGHEAILIDPKCAKSEDLLNAIEVSDGILTDLNFKMPGSLHDGITPSGLLVAIHAMLHQKACVICTKMDDSDNHHGKAMSWIYDGYIAPSNKGPLKDRILVLDEQKHWAFALRDLACMKHQDLFPEDLELEGRERFKKYYERNKELDNLLGELKRKGG